MTRPALPAVGLFATLAFAGACQGLLGFDDVSFTGAGPDAGSSSAGAGGTTADATAPDADVAAGSAGATPDAPPTTPPGFVLIPAGTFEMGSPADEPHHCGPSCTHSYDGEKLHTVTLTRSFWLGTTEVTQQAWQDATGQKPAVFAACGGDCPVENVTWREAAAYVTVLSLSEGLEPCYFASDGVTPFDFTVGGNPVWPKGPACLGYRLPTEAEWEYAARAATTTATYLGPADSDLDPIAWWGPNSACSYVGCDGENCRDAVGIGPSGTHPVGKKQANAWGLHDMLGNVWELVWDLAAEYPDGPVTDPTGPAQPAVGYHVARGCSWLSGSTECRAAARDGDDATCDPNDGPGCHTGFRVARTVP